MSAPSIAQNGIEKTDADEQFQRAVLDSAIKYELLKPRMYSLQKSNFHLEQQVAALQNEQRFMTYAAQLDKDSFASQLKTERRKRRRRVLAALAIGLAVGALTR